MEYPDRILKIEGMELIVDPNADVRGIGDERLKYIISNNIQIANEHENIQMIFHAIKRLLGEDISSRYTFNLTSFEPFESFDDCDSHNCY